MAECAFDSCPGAKHRALIERGADDYPRRDRMPRDDTPFELVFYCRKVYDFHGKRFIRNPG